MAKKTQVPKSPAHESTIPSMRAPTKLKERQSVRCTFRLSKEAATVLRESKKKYKTSIKDFIHYACDNLPSPKGSPAFAELVKSQRAGEVGQMVRKTQVVTRGTLRMLDHFKDVYDVSRDLLLQASILALRDALESYLKEMPEKYRKARESIADLCDRAKQIEKEIRRDLDSDHEYCLQFSEIVLRLLKLLSAIEDEVEE